MLERIGEAEEDAGGGGIEGVVAAEHHRDDGDPAAARAHVLGEDADRAERELRAGEAAERAGDDNGHDAIAGDGDAERLGRVRLFADAAQPQARSGS